RSAARRRATGWGAAGAASAARAGPRGATGSCRASPSAGFAERPGRSVTAGSRARAGPLRGPLRAGRFYEGTTMPLTVGQRLTVLRIDDALAMTHRFEFDVRSVLEPHPVGYQGRRQRVAVVRQRGKRKDFFLDVATDDILQI